jgi:hypothetical protein
LQSILPDASTNPAATFVPPISTPKNKTPLAAIRISAY